MKELIMKWEQTVETLQLLIANEQNEDMYAMMISRKNQLIECINDLKKLIS